MTDLELYKYGNKGPAILDIQVKLQSLGYLQANGQLDGNFGNVTKKALIAFQKDNKLAPDGIVGKQTWDKLLSLTYKLGDRLLYIHSPLLKGNDVKKLQELLAMLGFRVGKIDGIFGVATDKVVREFQSNLLLPADGIVGSQTLKSLQTLHGIVQNQPRGLLPFKLLKRQERIRPLFEAFIEVKYSDNPDKSTSSPIKKLAKQISNLLKFAGAKVKSKSVHIDNDMPKINNLGIFTIGIGFPRNISQKNITISYPDKDSNIKILAGETFKSIKHIAGDVPVIHKINAKYKNCYFVGFPDEIKSRLLIDEIYFQKIAVSITDAVTKYFMEVL